MADERRDYDDQDRDYADSGPAPVIPLGAVPARRIPRAPWSMIAPEFIATWGYPNGKFEPEHVEILGPTGSGKTYFEASILQERVQARDSAVVFIATKPVDATIQKLGWEIVHDWKGIEQNKQCVFWPKTGLLGTQRKMYLDVKIQDVLGRLWSGRSHTIVAFDEIATVESLSPEMKDLIAMYWREARSMGITIVAMKQRPQGVQRDMHSEASWVVSFHPKDEDDAERYAQIFGGRREWKPLLLGLDRSKHEFLLKHETTDSAVVSWVDIELKPPDKPRPYTRR